MRHVLFYMTPCGFWYVHSHKIYASEEKAHIAAKKFLHPDTPIFVMPISVPFTRNVIRVGDLT